jgi:hypothetical protein
MEMGGIEAVTRIFIEAGPTRDIQHLPRNCSTARFQHRNHYIKHHYAQQISVAVARKPVAKM